jgi:hypothetical protein
MAHEGVGIPERTPPCLLDNLQETRVASPETPKEKPFVTNEGGIYTEQEGCVIRARRRQRMHVTLGVQNLPLYHVESPIDALQRRVNPFIALGEKPALKVQLFKSLLLSCAPQIKLKLSATSHSPT